MKRSNLVDIIQEEVSSLLEESIPWKALRLAYWQIRIAKRELGGSNGTAADLHMKRVESHIVQAKKTGKDGYNALVKYIKNKYPKNPQAQKLDNI